MHFEDSIKQGPPLDFERQEDEKKNGVFLGRKSCSKSQSEDSGIKIEVSTRRKHDTKYALGCNNRRNQNVAEYYCRNAKSNVSQPKTEENN